MSSLLRVESDGLLDPRRELRQRFELIASRLLVAEERTEALGQRLLLLLGWDDGDLQRVDQAATRRGPAGPGPSARAASD